MMETVLETEPVDGLVSENTEHSEDLLDPRVQELEEEVGRVKDRLLRQAAEFQNFRRRTNKERGEWTRRAQILVLEAMLAVLDDFRRSLEASPQCDVPDTAFRDGVTLVYENFVAALAKLGVEAMEVVGELFDESLHEAILQVPALGDTAPGFILQEVQRGYRHGSQVLRHAKVVVAAQTEN